MRKNSEHLKDEELKKWNEKIADQQCPDGVGDMVLKAEEMRKWLVANQAEEVHEARMELTKMLKTTCVECARTQVSAPVNHFDDWKTWMEEREKWEKSG